MPQAKLKNLSDFIIYPPKKLYNIISYGFIDKSFKIGIKNLEFYFNLRYNERIKSEKGESYADQEGKLRVPNDVARCVC